MSGRSAVKPASREARRVALDEGRTAVEEPTEGLIAGFRLCAKCFDPYEWRLQGAITRQHCRCTDEDRGQESRWPRHDYNEHLHLCECCGMEPLRSGSKWSVWFCNECKALVDELNSRARFSAIPIGRHSLMNGVGLSGARLQAASDESEDDLVRALAYNLMGLFGSMDHLHAFASAHRKQLASWLRFVPGEDIALEAWFESTRRAAGAKPERFSKAAAFGSLERWFFEDPREASRV